MDDAMSVCLCCIFAHGSVAKNLRAIFVNGSCDAHTDVASPFRRRFQEKHKHIKIFMPSNESFLAHPPLASRKISEE